MVSLILVFVHLQEIFFLCFSMSRLEVGVTYQTMNNGAYRDLKC